MNCRRSGCEEGKGKGKDLKRQASEISKNGIELATNFPK